MLFPAGLAQPTRLEQLARQEMSWHEPGGRRGGICWLDWQWLLEDQCASGTNYKLNAVQDSH